MASMGSRCAGPALSVALPRVPGGPAGGCGAREFLCGMRGTMSRHRAALLSGLRRAVSRRHPRCIHLSELQRPASGL